MTQVAIDSLSSLASASSRAITTREITTGSSAYRQRRKGWIKTIYSHDFLEVQVKGSGSQPQPWLVSILESIQRLLLLRENWDSYGGKQITSAAARGAIEAVLWMNSQILEPWIVPTSKGGIQLEWHGRNNAGQNVDVEVEISPDGTTTVCCDPETHSDWQEIVRSLRRA